VGNKSEPLDLVETIRTLRNAAADGGDMVTAYRHERRLQILVGVPESFTGRRQEPETVEDWGGERSAPCVGCGGPHPYVYCGTDADQDEESASDWNAL